MLELREYIYFIRWSDINSDGFEIIESRECIVTAPKTKRVEINEEILAHPYPTSSTRGRSIFNLSMKR